MAALPILFIFALLAFPLSAILQYSEIAYNKERTNDTVNY